MLFLCFMLETLEQLYSQQTRSNLQSKLGFEDTSDFNTVEFPVRLLVVSVYRNLQLALEMRN